MKQVVIIAVVVVLIAAAITIDLALHDQPETGDSGLVGCPMYFEKSAADALPANHVSSQWQVYREHGTAGTAVVKVSTSTTATLSKQFSCQLSILRAPHMAGSGADWRIGHVVNPDGFRGKTVRYRAAIKADREMQLDTTQLYAYDGVKVPGAEIRKLTAEWQTFEVTFPVDPKATTFEVWFRLLIGHGTVRPGSGTLYFVPEIEIQAG
jgi:hypothetical protein